MVANTAELERKDRAFVAISGVIADADGLGIVADFLTRHSGHPLQWWDRFHHVLAHNLGFALLVTLASLLLGKRRWTTAVLACLSFHLQFIGDIVGARGPEGYQWPIPYLLPFSNAWQWTWEGRWTLHAWPNFVITGAALALTFYLTWRRGYSPLEIVSRRANKAFVGILRNRFGDPESSVKLASTL